jgi:hypothetical protein
VLIDADAPYSAQPHPHAHSVDHPSTRFVSCAQVCCALGTTCFQVSRLNPPSLSSSGSCAAQRGCQNSRPSSCSFSALYLCSNRHSTKHNTARMLVCTEHAPAFLQGAVCSAAHFALNAMRMSPDLVESASSNRSCCSTLPDRLLNMHLPSDKRSRQLWN